MEVLFTPWRYSYITRESAAKECVFCSASRSPSDPESLVLHCTSHHVVILNRYPYNNGHLMVAPLEHWASPRESGEQARLEFWPLVLTCQRVLETAYSPHGFNMGMNLGTSAGAGIADHYHLHIVPRWHGDSSFMGVISQVRLVPEELTTTWSRLRELFAEETS